MIYLDHAATSLHKPLQVAQVMYEALQSTGSSGRGAHGVALDASRKVYLTRQKLARLFNVGDASRVVFTANATDSLNIAIQGLLESGNHCITTISEHNSVLRPLYLMEQKGVVVTKVDMDIEVETSIIEEAIMPQTKAVVMTHASNVTGSISRIKEIGQICKKNKILFILDASQTAGLIEIDMQEMGIDVLCCSGHKGLLGPQGVGILCLAQSIIPKPLKAGGTGTDSFSKDMLEQSLPAYLEVGTLNTHGIIGLLAALEYIESYGIQNIFREANQLAQLFLEGVKEIPGIIIYGNRALYHTTPVVALNLRDIDSAELADELYERFGIATRAGAHCAPETHRKYGTVEQGMVRFSFSHFNSKEEVQQAITALIIIEEETR